MGEDNNACLPGCQLRGELDEMVRLAPDLRSVHALREVLLEEAVRQGRKVTEPELIRWLSNLTGQTERHMRQGTCSDLCRLEQDGILHTGAKDPVALTV